MQVETYTYTKMAGTFYLKKMLSSIKMDDHIAEMVAKGWKPGQPAPHTGPKPWGIGMSGDKITIIFTKE